MLSNQQIIEKFYSSFQQLDYTVMNQCYSDDIVFFDPAFGLLKDNEVRCMWEMLCKNARDFSITFVICACFLRSLPFLYYLQVLPMHSRAAIQTMYGRCNGVCSMP